MEELSPEFLSTIAQVSATFIGFALLIPAVQAIASGRTIVGERYISRKKFFKRWLLLLLLPISVLGYPLTFSLFLLTNAKFDGISNSINSLYEPLSIVFGLSIILLYLFWFRKWSKLMGWNKGRSVFRSLIEFMPPLFIGICLLMWLGLFGNLKWVFIFLIISGFWFIIRNIGVEVDKGLLFERADISCEFASAIGEFRNKVKEGVKKRESLIEKMVLLSRKLENKEEKEELKRSIGYSQGEIKNLRNLGEKIEKLYSEIVSKKKRICFKDFYEFEERKRDGERRIEEFEMGTVTAVEVLKSRYPKSVYRIPWDDESDER
jgi:hypothetical protein